MSDAVVAQPAYHFDAGHYFPLADENQSAYVNAQPFPHAVFDNFLPLDVVNAVLEEFPGPDAIPWTKFEDGGRTLKLATENQQLMGERTRHLFAELNGAVFVEFLERLTGIMGLVPDPFLHGGGLHQIEPGGFLDVHADFNLHPRFKLHRRLNVLIYLNHDWQDDWAGHLEFWQSDMSRRVQRIAPVFNRCVVFSTSRWAFHGHPQPLACPPGTTRRSIALYYYSANAPLGEGDVQHSTLYQSPGQAPALPRLYVDTADAGRYARLRRWVPPAVADAARAARERRQRSQ
ncbi:MAG: 2OG-Fe(II) oxygenase [Actinomycetes bacterium]